MIRNLCHLLLSEFQDSRIITNTLTRTSLQYLKCPFLLHEFDNFLCKRHDIFFLFGESFHVNCGETVSKFGACPEESARVIKTTGNWPDLWLLSASISKGQCWQYSSIGVKMYTYYLAESFSWYSLALRKHCFMPPSCHNRFMAAVNSGVNGSWSSALATTSNTILASIYKYKANIQNDCTVH